MNILQINNYGFVRGGSDRCFIDVSELLLRKGHHVNFLTTENEKNTVDSTFSVKGFNVESPSFFDIPNFFFSKDAQNKLRKLIEYERPDVAHLHIYYGQITPSILSILKEYGVPVVQTLHEYKLLCPISSMIRKGRACELCSGGQYWHAAWHRCNRGNLLRSTVTALESYSSDYLGAKIGITHFMAVSDFVRNKMIGHGMPYSQITTVHNFVRDDVFADNSHAGRYFLYIGRIEEIKGVGTLIHAMSRLPGVELLIVGTGEAAIALQQETVRLGLNNIRFLGFKQGIELKELIADAICVVSPSECFETFGLVLVESFAQCRPVIASKMGGMTEIVSHGIDGLLFDAGNVQQLSESLQWMALNRTLAVEMGKAGQQKAKTLFSAEKHYQGLIQIYEQAISSTKSISHLGRAYAKN